MQRLKSKQSYGLNKFFYSKIFTDGAEMYLRHSENGN